MSLPDVYRLAVIVQRPRTPTSTSPDAKSAHPNLDVVPDLDAALAALPVGSGLVIISTDNASHIPYAKKALETGKHVLVEKPLALHEHQVESLANLAREKGLVCTVYQNRRYDGDFLTLKSLLRHDGQNPSALGLPTYLESRFDRFRPIAKGGWREEVDPRTEGGGMLWDLGAHLVDQVVSLFGPPAMIYGMLRNQRNQGPANVDDDWLAVLSYPDYPALPGDAHAPGTRLGGLRVVLGATCLSTHVDAEQSRFRVEGTHGSYMKRGTDPQEAQLKRGWTPKTHGDAFGVYEKSEPAAVRLARLTTCCTTEEPATATKPPPLAVSDIPILPGSYLSLYSNIADAIHAADDAKDAADASNAIQNILDVNLSQISDATRVIRMIRQSAEEGRSVSFR